MGAMKINLRPKYFIASIIALSAFSFAYVNLHAAYLLPGGGKEQVKITQPVLVEDEEEKNQNLAVPDITILSRIIDLVHRYSQTER